MHKYFIHARCDEGETRDDVYDYINAENFLDAFKQLVQIVLDKHYSKHGDFDIDVDFFLKSNLACPTKFPSDDGTGVFVFCANDDDIWQETLIDLGRVEAAK